MVRVSRRLAQRLDDGIRRRHVRAANIQAYYIVAFGGHLNNALAEDGKSIRG
jgi:hypothetical protein